MKFTNIEGTEIGDIEVVKIVGYFPAFSAGYLLKKHERRIMPIVLFPHVYSITLIIFVLAFMVRYINQPLLYHATQSLHPFIAILPCHVIFCLFYNMDKKNVIFRLFCMIGRLSMPIYILHILFVVQIPSIGDFCLRQIPATAITLQICYGTMFTIVAIMFSIILYKILNKSRFISQLIFGNI